MRVDAAWGCYFVVLTRTTMFTQYDVARQVSEPSKFEGLWFVSYTEGLLVCELH